MFEIEKLRENPALLKLELLANGIRGSSNFDIRENEAQDKYFYDNAKDLRGKVPSELILPQNVVVNLYNSQDSPFSIQGRKLFLNQEEVSEVRYTPEASFSSATLTNGKPMSRVATMYGLDIFAIFLNRGCVLFKTGEECQFCSLDNTRKTLGKANTVNPSLEEVTQTFKFALTNDKALFNYVVVSSGAYPDPDKGLLEQMKYLNGMREVDQGKVKYHLVTVPPRSDELLRMLARKGPNNVAFDMELFDKELFERYCPGKSRQIGHKGFLDIFDRSGKYFDKSVVKIGFVGGLEPLNSLVKGMEFVAQRGLVPTINIFHPDKGTALAEHPRPSSGYLLDLTREQMKIYRKYELIPVFPEYGRRGSLDTEIHRGFFDNEFS